MRGAVLLTTLRLHNTYVRNMRFSSPSPNTPLVLVSVADQIVWWDVSKALEVEPEKRRKSVSRRSRGSVSQPENLNLSSITAGVEEISINSIWTGKRGRLARPDLLSAIKLSGDHAAKISISPRFTSFVTLDSAGLMYILSVLDQNEPFYV